MTWVLAVKESHNCLHKMLDTRDPIRDRNLSRIKRDDPAFCRAFGAIYVEAGVS